MNRRLVNEIFGPQLKIFSAPNIQPNSNQNSQQSTTTNSSLRPSSGQGSGPNANGQTSTKPPSATDVTSDRTLIPPTSETVEADANSQSAPSAVSPTETQNLH